MEPTVEYGHQAVWLWSGGDREQADRGWREERLLGRELRHGDGGMEPARDHGHHACGLWSGGDREQADCGGRDERFRRGAGLGRGVHGGKGGYAHSAGTPSIALDSNAHVLSNFLQ